MAAVAVAAASTLTPRRTALPVARPVQPMRSLRLVEWVLAVGGVRARRAPLEVVVAVATPAPPGGMAEVTVVAVVAAAGTVTVLLVLVGPALVLR